MPFLPFIAAGAVAVIAYEKAGDWWNTRAGVVTVPVDQVTGQPKGSTGAVLIGAGLVLGGLYLARKVGK